MTQASQGRNARRAQKVSHVHWKVKQVAMEAAGQLYEKLMADNKIFEAWKKQNPDCQNAQELELKFIAKNWSKCVPYARATMAIMLRGPLPSALKDEISDALILDARLVRGRADPKVIAGALKNG